MKRRAFCAFAGVALASASVDPRTLAEGIPGAVAADGASSPASPRLYTSLKITMIKGDRPLVDKLRLAKEAGFDGISLTAPHTFDVQEAIAARDQAGLIIHDVVNAVHWNQRLSDPDATVREQSLEALLESIRFAHAIGASSVLQVVGKVTDPENENHDQVWQRSKDAIRRAIPLASKLGIRILCENVGNGFCEDAQQWADYLDEIADPWVGAFFDIGNHHSRGGAPHWIRTLGNRIVKIDVKGHDTTTRRNCDILAGDVDWAAVRAELAKLEFSGWAVAEVAGGDAERIQQIAREMDEVLAIQRAV
ncbi:MAG: sugar phosphate isomerase/epimerase family protein [Planctomycetaceae bacterium]